VGNTDELPLKWRNGREKERLSGGEMDAPASLGSISSKLQSDAEDVDRKCDNDNTNVWMSSCLTAHQHKIGYLVPL